MPIAPGPGDPGAAGAAAARLKVLVVNDEPAFTERFANRLAALGMACVTARSGEHAVAAFVRELPDMVLMDVAMPGMDGLEATRRIRSHGGERWVPVVLLSATADDGTVAAGLAAGADDYLVKPLNAALAEAKILALGRMLRLRQRLEIAAGVFGHIRDGVIITDANQRIVDVNPAFTEITGFTREEVLGRAPRIYGSALTPRAVYEDMWRQVREQGYWRGELVNRRKDGIAYPELVSVVAVKEAGEVRHYVAILSRVNTHHDDAVTGLPGPRTLRRHLSEVIDAARAGGRRAALLVLDIDRFREVNEALGFVVGDMVLREIAQRLRGSAGIGGHVYRLGNDEFAVVAADAGDGGAVEDMAEGIPDVLAQPFHLGNEVVHATASVGVAFYPDDAADVETLLANADHALQSARPMGGGRTAYFVAARQRDARVRRKLVDDLRHGVGEGRFSLVYQPIIELATGRIVKAEALLRWLDPERGLVTPAAFIPASERAGLIKPMGNWALGEALAAVARIRRRSPDFQMSVNVSAVQVMDEDFDARHLLGMFHAAGVPGAAIVLEFTEGLLMHAIDAVLTRLRALREAGIALAIDDFGTGYSSLSYLHQFPVDYLKIDRSFVEAEPGDTRKLSLCEAIVTMGHALGLKVIAEGIETSEQRARLAAMGCDFGQGYLFGHPVELAALEDSLAMTASTPGP